MHHMPEQKQGMQKTGAGTDGDDQSTVAALKDKVTETASKAKDKVADLGRSAAEKIDENRESAAGTLESAASTLHEKAVSLPGGETVAKLAHTAADKLESTAGYVREHDVQSMITDVEDLVRRHPGQSLVAAATVGFLLGRMLKSDD
jgi:ElaB/YqjD/DUF883 family membrane-anchored ribosome-binding protein